MNTTIKKIITPEERELNKKLAELAKLEEELSRRELDLATLQAELRTFERRYIRIVGSRYAELDEIRARIAEARARLSPEDRSSQEEAGEARARADESSKASAEAQETEPRQQFKPSDNLKKLYREIARQIHPDLTTNEQDRARRHQFMVEVNRAYETGDEERLRNILQEWQGQPESVEEGGIGADLIRVIRKIAQVEDRLAAIEIEIEELRHSELHQLFVRVREAENKGRDLLYEMAKDLDNEIADEKADGYGIMVKLIEKLDAKAGSFRRWK